MKKLAINSGDAFILVYSVDDPQSLDDLEQLRQTILDEREQAHLDSLSAAGARLAAAAASNNNDHRHHHASSSGSSSSTSLAMAGSSSLTSSSLQQQHNQLHPTIGTAAAPGPIHQAEPASPSRHWSLASLFGQHGHSMNTANLILQQQLFHGSSPPMTSASTNTATSATCAPAQQLQGNGNAGGGGTWSLNSSLNSSSGASSSASCCSSADNSRRSSISAAEAALRTRRTRKPPMVIVANKHDLPRDRHQVNSDEIEALAVIDWNNGFVRASAALNWNIDEIFQQVLKQARQPPTLAEAIVSKRRKSLPPKLPQP